MDIDRFSKFFQTMLQKLVLLPPSGVKEKRLLLCLTELISTTGPMTENVRLEHSVNIKCASKYISNLDASFM